MAKRILTPVAAGEASETIVPVVAALAQHSGATVRLLRVMPIPEMVVGTHGRTVAYADQEMARLEAEAQIDLARIEAALGAVPVERVVRFGEPAEEILLEAESFGADLIALAAPTHGRLHDLLSSGVAARVTRKSSVPTLALHERGQR